MIRLLYVSTSRTAADVLANNLSGILESSKRNNKPLGITGILLHGGGMYMQVLEGPDHQVFSKYLEIIGDKRHTDCQIILITTTEERAFSDWAMAVLEISDHEFQRIRKLFSRRHESVDIKIFSDMIRSFMNGLGGK